MCKVSASARFDSQRARLRQQIFREGCSGLSDIFVLRAASSNPSPAVMSVTQCTHALPQEAKRSNLESLTGGAATKSQMAAGSQGAQPSTGVAGGLQGLISQVHLPLSHARVSVQDQYPWHLIALFQRVVLSDFS